MQIYEDAATAAAGAAAEKAAEEAFVAASVSPCSDSSAAGASPASGKTSRSEELEPRPVKSPNRRLRKARRAEERQQISAHKVSKNDAEE